MTPKETNLEHQQIYNTFCKPSQDEIKESIKEILHTLKGNGSVGLVTKVALLEQASKECSLKKDKPSGFLPVLVQNWQLMLVLIALILSTINALSDKRLTKEEISSIIQQTKMLDSYQSKESKCDMY